MGAHDVVVIGAGNGGLTASLVLAKKGLSVLLLERHNIPGGCATSFCRGRFEFEVALHQLSGVGTEQKPGPLRMLLGDLGVLDDLDLVEMSDLYCFQLRDDFHIALEANRESAVAELQARFPREREAIGKFFDLCYAFSSQFLGAFYFKDPEVTREKYPLVYAYSFKPAIEVLNEFFDDDVLKAVLSMYWGFLGLPPTRLSFAYLALLFFTYLEFKPFHIKGGSQALSNCLASKFLSNGGTIRFNCGAKRILVENGAVSGVITEDGEEIPTKYVISNTSPIATYLKLIGQDKVPTSALTDMASRTLSPSAFVIYLGLDGTPEEVGIKRSSTFLAMDTDLTDRLLDRMRRLEIDDDMMMVSCYDIADPDFAPAGACQTSVVSLKYGDAWLRVPPTEYHRVKFECAEAMLRRLEKLAPRVRSHIEEIEVGTPLTHMRYLQHPAGSIYGFEQYMKDSLFLRPDRASPIKGLHFASGWVGDPGFQPTLEAGQSVARTIIREIRTK
jgi:phytoene dehydrogenase-like protein